MNNSALNKTGFLRDGGGGHQKDVNLGGSRKNAWMVTINSKRSSEVVEVGKERKSNK